MTLIIENGTGVVDANSYASVEELEEYATYRYDLTSKTTEQMESALVIASSDWVDGQHNFRSEPLTDTQGLFFPTVLDGFPSDIKKATLKAALLQIQGLLMVDLSSINTSGEVQSESKKLGPLEKSVSYVAGTSQRYSRILPSDLTKLLNPYLSASEGLGFTRRL